MASMTWGSTIFLKTFYRYIHIVYIHPLEINSTYVSSYSQEIRSIKLDNANASHGLAFVGIFCTAGDFIQRDLVRHTSNLLAPPGLALRFVICQPLSASSNPILEAESQLHGDIVFLDCVENMDKGKSLQFFQVVRQTFPNYHFYAKTDLDSYNLYFNVAYALDQAPKCGLYMGQRYYHEGVHYHVGHMYILSTDLVARLESCGDKCPDVIDFEDRSIGKFLNRLVGKENLQWADWGLRHVVYGADGTLLGHAKRNGPLVKELFTPWLVLLHGMKSHNWIEGHTYVREVITVDTIRAAKYEKFAD